MADSISRKRKIISIISAWLVFIGIDFLFHASILASYWNEDIPALKSLDDLAMLIPAGYLSFLLLTALIGYLFFKIFKSKPEKWKVTQFGFVFGILYSLSNVFGLYSYIELPIKQLMAYNLVYFIEIFAVCLCLNYFAFSGSSKKAVISSFLTLLILMIAGVVIQNVFPYS